jgi:hypothetical protein
MARKTKQEVEINRTYAVWFNGVTVNLWNLPAIYADIKTAIDSGDPEAQREAIVAKYCEAV